MSLPSSESILEVSGTASPPASPEMSSKPSNHADGKRPMVDADAAVPEAQPDSHNQVPTPPPSHNEGDNNVGEDDYSDALSADSQTRQKQRRHPRGGRKQKQQKPSARHLQSVSEYEIPTSSREAPPQEDEEDYFEGEHDEDATTSPLDPPEAEHKQDDYDASALKKARGSRSKAQPRQPPVRNRSTGINSFSIQRPRGGGRKPPVSVSVERPGNKSKVKSKYDERKQKAARKACGEEDSEDDEDEDESEKEEEPKKPVQIQLDLNLEIELLIKMKINGNVIITFLE